jgi:hypothetical protein
VNQRVIYQTEGGGVAILTPAPECLIERTIKEIADKDVPAGVPYKIIDFEDIPTDFTFRDAWEAQIDTPDGVGADSNEFAPKNPA